MGKKLTKAEALKKIEELKKYVDEVDIKETKTVGFAIKHWANSAQVIYQSTKETQREAILEAVGSGANLRNADLNGADLRDADLNGADLNGADLRDADLSDADLRDADLNGADLNGADLYGANLSDAYLNGANLSDAYLYGANLYGTELRDARFYGKGGTKPLKRSQLPDFLAALGFVIDED